MQKIKQQLQTTKIDSKIIEQLLHTIAVLDQRMLQARSHRHHIPRKEIGPWHSQPQPGMEQPYRAWLGLQRWIITDFILAPITTKIDHQQSPQQPTENQNKRKPQTRAQKRKKQIKTKTKPKPLNPLHPETEKSDSPIVRDDIYFLSLFAFSLFYLTNKSPFINIIIH